MPKRPHTGYHNLISFTNIIPSLLWCKTWSSVKYKYLIQTLWNRAKIVRYKITDENRKISYLVAEMNGLGHGHTSDTRVRSSLLRRWKNGSVVNCYYFEISCGVDIFTFFFFENFFFLENIFQEWKSPNCSWIEHQF